MLGSSHIACRLFPYRAISHAIGLRPENVTALTVDKFLYKCKGLRAPFLNELRLVNLTELQPIGLRLGMHEVGPILDNN